MRRYVVFFGLAGVLIVSGLIQLVYGHTSLHATKISDTHFVASANSSCKAVLPALVDKQPQRNQDLKNSELLPLIRSSASEMKKLQEKLSQIPVADADKAAVTEWTSHWASYANDGYLYATALESNNKSEWNRLGNKSAQESKAITAFALVNHISDCALRTQVASTIM